MASSRKLLSEEQLLCSICLDVFTDPVTTPCGHNFCKKCLAGYWDSSDHCQCPMCNMNFEMRPDLYINTLISETVAQFKVNTGKSTKKNVCASAEVSCDACTGVKQISVKSCLNCGASYCQIHLEPHKTIQSLKKHKLINPVENVEDYICQKHERPLELFCRDDQMCVCQFCIDGDHKNHKTVSIEEANDELKACLKKTQTEVQQMIQERLEKTEEIKKSLELSKKSTKEDIAQGVEVFTALIRSIERSQAELLEALEEKQKATDMQAEGLIKEMEQEITVLQSRDLQLDIQLDLSDAENYHQQIQIYSSMCSPPCTKNWTDTSIDSDLSRDTLRTSLSHLHKELNNKLDEEMQKLTINSFSMNPRQLLLLLLLLPVALLIPEVKLLQMYAVDVTLDPDTANSDLILSEDGKQVREHTSTTRIPFHIKRFAFDPYVLAKEGFSSGRFYFEVQVSGKIEWDIGVAKESIERHGEFYPDHSDGTWSMIRRHDSGYRVCVQSCVTLTLKEVEKVGVFVDYEEGLVSFYDAESSSHIYSITGQYFTEKLYPFFSPGFSDNNANSLPLIICDRYKYLLRLRQFSCLISSMWKH